MPDRDSESYRLRFILEAQEHCDHFLTPLADPGGRSVLVLGCGAGSEMLWALRHGAREVVGIDLADQSPQALSEAAARFAVGDRPWSIERLGVEEATRLGRKFDLVLSNNVLEHLADLDAAFAAAAELVEPTTGSVAVFTSPLYYSSRGSHLPTRPWEHLVADPGELGEQLRRELPSEHPLQRMELERYLFEEITLNRARPLDMLAAAWRSGLVVLNLQLLVDDRIQELPALRSTLESRAPAAQAADLATRGLGLELLRLGEALPAHAHRSTAERRAAAGAEVVRQQMARLEEEVRTARGEMWKAREETEELRSAFRQVLSSRSYRLGRLLTSPIRMLRSL